MHNKSEFVEELSSINKRENDLVFKEGEKGTFMFVIIKGRVKVFLGGEKEEIVLATLGKGNFFGEMGLFSGKARSASVKALTDLTLLRITREDIKRLRESNAKLLSEFAIGLCTELCKRISRTDDSLESYYYINRAVLRNSKFRNFLKKIWNEKEE